MPAIITDTFDYDDIVRVLDLDEAFVQHQVDNREEEAPVTLESRPLMAYFESSRSVGGLLYA